MTREEFQEKCRVRRLNIGDRVSAFDCHDDDLNDFIFVIMTVPTFDREKEAIMKDVREMIHRNRDNGFILEELQNKYGKDFSDDDLKALIKEATK